MKKKEKISLNDYIFKYFNEKYTDEMTHVICEHERLMQELWKGKGGEKDD